jgi:hypothetical protein
MITMTTMLEWLLPFLGAAIAISAFLLNFRKSIDKFRKGDSTTILLGLVTLLSVAFGVERLVSAEQLGRQLSTIEKQLTTIAGGRFLDNYNEVYNAGTKICSTADQHIKAIVTSGPKAPNYFIEAIAERLKDRKKAGYNTTFQIVLVVDSQQTDLDSFEKKNAERLAVFDKYGVKDSIAVYVLDSKPTLSFDVLIVDRKHVNIGITSSKEGKKVESAIVFENQAALASAYDEWFDNSILPLAKPLEQWVNEQRTKRDNTFLIKPPNDINDDVSQARSLTH